MRRLMSIVAVATATACAPVADGASLELAGEPVPTAEWADAPASCTCVEGAASVRPTEVPELGVLFDAGGRVLCVDVVDLLVIEHPHAFAPPLAQRSMVRSEEPRRGTMLGGDPSPDPMRGGDPSPDPMIGDPIRGGDPDPDPMRPSRR